MLQFLQLQSWLKRFSKASGPHPVYAMCLPLAADDHPFNSANSNCLHVRALNQLLITTQSHTLSLLDLSLIFSCCVTRGNTVSQHWYSAVDMKQGHWRETESRSQSWGLKRRVIWRDHWFPAASAPGSPPSTPFQSSLFHWSYVATLERHKAPSCFNYEKCNIVFVQKPT